MWEATLIYNTQYSNDNQILLDKKILNVLDMNSFFGKAFWKPWKNLKNINIKIFIK